jgi:hypothetical protein
VPARIKQPPAVAKQDDAKGKEPDSGKENPRKANGAPSDSPSSTEFERWSGLDTGIPGTRR